MKKLVLIAAILISESLVFAQIINIPADYPTIQRGINNANDGDTVLVQPGTYYENIEVIYSGWNGNLTLASLYLITQDTSYISSTIIDGNQEGSVISFYNMAECNIIGFTIQNGNANSPLPRNSGGGIYLFLSSPNFKLQNLIIKNNSALYYGGYGHEAKGGGIYIHCNGEDTLSGGILKDVSIIDNEAWYGGGIYCENFHGILQNVTIDNNRASEKGGGGYFLNSNPTLQNVMITSNTAIGGCEIGYGGGLYFDGSNPVLQNVVISENWPTGIKCTNSNIALINSTISEHDYEGLWCDESNALIENSIFWGNGNDNYGLDGQISTTYSFPVSISFSNIEDGEDGIRGPYNWLEGNINEGPLFLNSGDHPYQINDYSPCIDAGTPDTTGLNLPEFDLAGNSRLANNRVDMGAYEWNILVGVEEQVYNETETAKVSIYPNPVVSTAMLSGQFALYLKINICIYNTNGSCLKSWEFTNQQPGQQEFNLDLNDLFPGIYFLRLQAGNETITRKIIKI